LLFSWRNWFVPLKHSEHHLREGVRVLAHFPQCGAQRIRVCFEHRVNTSPHCDHLVTIFWHFFAKHKVFVVVSPSLRRVCDIAFIDFVDLFVLVSEFFAKVFGDRRVAVALLTLHFSKDCNAF
jgi:hypothetical protein